MFPVGGYGPIGNTVQPQYCWYDIGDKLQVVWYIQYQDLATFIDDRNENGRGTTMCQLSGSYMGTFGSKGYSQGGFEISETPPDYMDYRDRNEDYWEERYSIAVGGGAGEVVLSRNFLSSGSEFYIAASVFCTGDELVEYMQIHDPFIPGNPEPVHVITMTASLGAQTESLRRDWYRAGGRQWTFCVPAYDAEAAYILNTTHSEMTVETSQIEFSGSTSPTIGGNPFAGGTIKFDFYTPGGTLLHTIIKNDMIKTLTPGLYDYGSWFGIINNECDPEDLVVTNEAETTIYPAKYTFYSPHGSIDLPEDGYWPTLFPESVLEGFLIEGQPIRALLSWNGDGLYYSEEGAAEKIGGYVPDPGIQALFIGGA
jgi:hypothetical protein